MDSMTRELAAKHPATVVTRTALARGRMEVMVAPYARRAALVEEARRQQGCGLVRVLDTHPIYSKTHDQWELRVRRIALPTPRPRWIKPVIITGVVLAVLGLLVAVGLWVAATLAAIPLGLLLGLILLIFIGCVVGGGRAGMRRATQVSVDVRVRVR